MNNNKKISCSLNRGAQIIADYVKKLPNTPGVYRMLGEDGSALYVGKAKALKKRVTSYTHVEKLPIRLQRMVALTYKMEFVHTHTEVEALLLESNLIKKLKPHYNILLRDDKSFPYILITGDHDFSQVKKHRGARKGKTEEGGGEYFGPFASAGAVNNTIDILQRAFKLRNCSNSIFANRKRPCLQYHIKRCTAPCVGLVSQKEYATQVENARKFLSGESRDVQNYFADKMQKFSDAEDFEKAAEFRDRIKAMSLIHTHQDINVDAIGDVDVVVIVQNGSQSCVQVFFFRGGQNFGNKAYYPKHDKGEELDNVLSSFIAQFYENKPVPKNIMVNILPSEKELLEKALIVKRDGQKVSILKPERGQRKRLIDFAVKNAEDSMKRRISKQASEKEHLKAVAELFDIEKMPTRIEVYDNSHISGTNQVGGMVVAGVDGFHKAAYRKFNIKTADESDDYGMMREVMSRRFGRALKENVVKGSEDFPDLLLIDGGKGQLSAVTEVLKELGIYDNLTVVAIAKGPDRNAGREQFFMNGKEPFTLPIDDQTLHYLQRLRDEVHRFAIGAHRTRRKNDISKSPLDGIAGIGAKRKKALLLYFGSGKDVASAGIEDLLKVEGISRPMAEKIYGYFNNN